MKTTIAQSAFTLDFVFAVDTQPIHARGFPEEPREVTATFEDLLLNRDPWIPAELGLVGTVDASVEVYYAPDAWRTFSCQVTFVEASPAFATAYRTKAKARRALLDLIEKFQSMCATPGALTWATDRLSREAHPAAPPMFRGNKVITK